MNEVAEDLRKAVFQAVLASVGDCPEGWFCSGPSMCTACDKRIADHVFTALLPRVAEQIAQSIEENEDLQGDEAAGHYNAGLKAAASTARGWARSVILGSS